MAPSFDHLRDADVDEDDYDEDEIDISDLREKYEVQLEQGYDTFVVIDGLPEVTEEQKPKLVKFLLKKLTQVGKTKEDLVYMPMGEDGKSLRYAHMSMLFYTGVYICIAIYTCICLSFPRQIPKLIDIIPEDSPLSNFPRPPRLPPPSDSSTWSRSTRSTRYGSTR